MVKLFAWFIIVSINHCFIIAVNQPANRRNASRSRGLCINGWTACQEDGEEKMVGVLVMTSMMLWTLETLQHRFQCSQSNLSNAFCDRACRSQILSSALWYRVLICSLISIYDHYHGSQRFVQGAINKILPIYMFGTSHTIEMHHALWL